MQVFQHLDQNTYKTRVFGADLTGYRSIYAASFRIVLTEQRPDRGGTTYFILQAEKH